MYVDSKTSILLQTCIALASNPTSVQPQEKHRVRIILNSGIQKTYITQKLQETFSLKQVARERLCIRKFGSDYNNLKTVDVVNLCLKNVDNYVTITVTAHRLKDVALSECTLEENLVVDIPIGANQ